MKRFAFVLCIWLVALGLQATTPELGKEKLRRLVKLPVLSFQSEWTFDPEQGFILGSNTENRSTRIRELRKELKANPEDADGFLRLGGLYADNGDSSNARTARTKAVQLLRKRLEAQPDDAALLAMLGQALQESGKRPEAESVLRRAVQSGPGDWKCWLALGRFLDKESRQDILEAGAPADRVTQARKRLDEAGDCFNAAVTNAPDQAEVYRLRGLHRTLVNYLLNEIRESQGEEKREVEVLSDYFSKESLADLQKASRLDEKDGRLIGNATLFEIYCVNARNGRKNVGDGFDWTMLPDATQRSIRDSLTRLDGLAEDPDAKVAAEALEVLGVLQGPVLHETNTRVASLKRAVALDPSRERAWEMLASTLGRTERYEELLAVCEDHLKQTDTARSHMLLAKAYERLKRWEDAEEQVALAFKQTPNDLTVNLAFAALLLRRSQDEDVLNEASGWLARCEQILANLPAVQKPRHLVVDFTLTRSIYLALSDDVETARRWAKTVIDSDEDNETAREILSAIAY